MKLHKQQKISKGITGLIEFYFVIIYFFWNPRDELDDRYLKDACLFLLNGYILDKNNVVKALTK